MLFFLGILCTTVILGVTFWIGTFIVEIGFEMGGSILIFFFMCEFVLVLLGLFVSTLVY